MKGKGHALGGIKSSAVMVAIGAFSVLKNIRSLKCEAARVADVQIDAYPVLKLKHNLLAFILVGSGPTRCVGAISSIATNNS